MTLSQMNENESGYIVSIDNNSGFERRFLDMGFMTGQRIRCTNIGLFGSPIACLICGSKVALRKKDADKIGVIM